MQEDGKLCDFGGYPEISAASVADVHFLTANARFIFFDWYKEEGVWQRRVVGTVKVPISSLRPEQLQHYGYASHRRPGIATEESVRH